MEIKREDIIHMAELSRLSLSNEEIEKYTKNMQDIVGFANKVNEVNTDDAEVSAFALDTYNVFRKDEVKPSFDREELLKNAPSSNGEAFSIPNVME